MKLEDTETSVFTMDDVNAEAKNGWRIVTWLIEDGGNETVLLERELE